ncbi:membrane protein [Salmonella enterica subsp. arizonae]|uniref:Membrane protein n=1 Tax=Salmonella enterica subsp. arizonae TaxID=59203 RepID=A0A379TQI5_SALER|nr:membrane protein [Salmonella enterica subsp. arizonae]
MFGQQTLPNTQGGMLRGIGYPDRMLNHSQPMSPQNSRDAATWHPAENHQSLKLKVRADIINAIGADTIHAPAQQICRPLGLIDGINQNP